MWQHLIFTRYNVWNNNKNCIFYDHLRINDAPLHTSISYRGKKNVQLVLLHPTILVHLTINMYSNFCYLSSS